jgi:hypothetical protein
MTASNLCKTISVGRGNAPIYLPPSLFHIARK